MITRETRGFVRLIGLNRPEKKNAFTAEMLREFASAVTELDESPELRAGVVFAHGADFTAGLDLASVAPELANSDRLLADNVVDPWGTHGRPCSKPVLVAVQGRCLTLGIELILAADICVAAPATKFAQIEIKRGIFPFGGGTMHWVQRIGWGNAMRWLLTADEFDAAEAHRIGLVQEIADDPKARAIEIAERISAQAPLGVAATIRSARQAIVEGEAAAARDLVPTLKMLMQTEDAMEGLASFMERRTANFQGR